MSNGTWIAFAAIGLVFFWLYKSEPEPYTPSSGAGLVEITPANFQPLVMQSSQPVLAYFWASW
tara:strand:- start:4311 stop:4499 length:189 start_codon:yes stop_codon:yes gene_type:complete